MGQPKAEITALLASLEEGDEAAVAAIIPLLYDELHRMAQRHLHGERPDHTLNATALVHEAYLKLVDQRQSNWKNRAHFLGVASTAMRRILINYARDRRALKRGGGLHVITLVENEVAREASLAELIMLDEAITRLSEFADRAGKVVTMRFFGGLKQDEIAAALNVAVPTVKRDWQVAKAWLSRELESHL